MNAHFSRADFQVGRGAIVDATIIHAPSSTKNKEGLRDPEMHQTKKVNKRYLGMNAHVGMDCKNGLVRSFVATAANVHDSRASPGLLHENETRVFGDSAYHGQRDAMIGRAPRSNDFTNRPGSRGRALSDRKRSVNRTKSRVRSKIEHAFDVVKRLWGFAKVRYREIAKNSNRLFIAFGLGAQSGSFGERNIMGGEPASTLLLKIEPLHLIVQSIPRLVHGIWSLQTDRRDNSGIPLDYLICQETSNGS